VTGSGIDWDLLLAATAIGIGALMVRLSTVRRRNDRQHPVDA